MSARQAVACRYRQEIDLWSLLVWAYQRQQVVAETGRVLQGLERAMDGPARAHSRDGVAAALRIAELGCHVDGGPPGPEASRCHPDAELLHAIVLSLPFRLARVLIDAAEMGEQPERCGFTPRWRRVARHGVNAGSWTAVPAPDDLSRCPVFFKGRRCVRDDSGFHFECLGGDGETALVWSPWCPVEEWPVTTAYAQLADSIADAFAEALQRLERAVDGVQFQDHIVLRSTVGL